MSHFLKINLRRKNLVEPYQKPCVYRLLMCVISITNKLFFLSFFFNTKIVFFSLRLEI